MNTYANTPWDALEIGMEASAKRLCRTEDFLVYASSSGNHNPVHLPKADHDGDGRPDMAVAPSMWVASLVSAVLGNQLPGPGTLYRGQNLRFLGRAHAGDELTVHVRLTEKRPDNLVVFATRVTKADGSNILEGEATVIAPTAGLSFEADDLPGLTVQRHVHFDRLLELAEPLAPLPTAVICPDDPNSLGGALLAAAHTLITPILVGDQAKIRATGEALGADLAPFEIIDVVGDAASAARAVRLVNEGRAGAVMKGHLHTDDLLRAVVKSDGGLRTRRRLSHVFCMDVPGLDHLLMITDAAINIAPELHEKVDIIQNAIDLGRALGIETPKVAVLSAVETVNPKLPSTIEAAALAKMADRGQIRGGVVDGPLAMDNAVDEDAARTKGITSLVAGHADILMAPNLESANMIAKQLTFLAHAEAGGLVLGAKCPVILSSRADDDKARLASCAVAALYHQWQLDQ
ncbi:MAG: bifunctional enoyl-CoA hydratase/phosphate acetyltransferase [Roseitalea sp.]|jgi:phosphate butyryltransferase|nr:bifunctional enoyl-CoA hydratase/phosphate acetyltransferase [Roseitalea sp.]MBO6723282.1 bifunctional enoyl-CoA hydratase/phosphate acetyltransferase [Roseitalea sp.]MBO6742532.1 bifunctional enoyl-CoA hydratase/phosphate acetyltransferase [Roseitalea sp.]